LAWEEWRIRVLRQSRVSSTHSEQLAIITPEAIAAWKDAIKQQQQKVAEFAAAQERARQAALEKQQRQAAELAAARERQQKAALEQQQRQAAELAAEQERERQAVASCDQMAANPSDVRKSGDVAGVPYNDLKTNAKAAADACTLAMRVNPEEIRYRYQYARALEIDDPKKALKIHEQLIHDGYLASYDNAGSILIGTYKNIPEAIKYFNEGVRRGDPADMRHA
jgi:DNA-binding helix-hairpin-helix protein with protein kinase domain